MIGLDPDPTRLWPGIAEDLDAGSGDDPRRRAAGAVAAHCRAVLEAVAPECVAVKLQVAWFESLGPPGWAALESVARQAAAHGLLVIADAKRGDIDVSAAAYGRAFFGATETPFGPLPGLGADALTVNPLLGRDSLLPLRAAARAIGAGLFLLVRTSNPGAGDVQDRELADGSRVSDRLAALAAELGSDAIGPAGLSDIGAVTGATAPEHLERLRAAMPAAPFLLPGVGAQGGSIAALRAAFAPGPAGGLVAVSRGIVYAFEERGGEPGAAARTEAARLRERAWEMARRV